MSRKQLGNPVIYSTLVFCAFLYHGLYSKLAPRLQFKLQRLYFPMDSVRENKARMETYLQNQVEEFIHFPNNATKYPVSVGRQLSNAAISLNQSKGQHGILNTPRYPWLYDFSLAPQGVSIFLWYRVTELPNIPLLIASSADIHSDGNNMAGFDIKIDGNSKQLVIRFGYRQFNWECLCGPKSASAAAWHYVHASARNHLGLFDYAMAVDGKDCDKDGECGKTELTPNYDLTAIKEIRFGYSNPKESSKALLQIDEVKFFNTFMEIPVSAGEEKCCKDRNCSSGCGPYQIQTIRQKGQTNSLDNRCSDKNECTRYPCGEECMDIGSRNFSCSCRNPVTHMLVNGTQCLSSCNDVTCYFNSECEPFASTGNFSCKCDKHHSGDFCEYQTKCGPESCVHGTCVRHGGYYQCDCNSGYEGQRCDQKILDCHGNPCRHNGECLYRDDKVLTESDSVFMCKCKTGWTGEFCDTELTDPCTGVDCGHGICQHENSEDDLMNSPYCVCEPLYTGSGCKEQINPCKPDPCEKGTCESLESGKSHCACFSGFTGTYCEQEVDECLLPGICPNATHCRNTFGGHNCDCPKDKVSPGCKSSTAICDINPCLNNGICRSNSNVTAKDIGRGASSTRKFASPLYCDCPEGFDGDYCENRKGVAQDCIVYYVDGATAVWVGMTLRLAIVCLELGDEFSAQIDFGDEYNFTVPSFVYEYPSKYGIYPTLANITSTLPPDHRARFIYATDHIYRTTGPIFFRVMGFNHKEPSFRYLRDLNVEASNMLCMPDVELGDGRWKLFTMPDYPRSIRLTIKSVVSLDPNCEHGKPQFNWTLYSGFNHTDLQRGVMPSPDKLANYEYPLPANAMNGKEWLIVPKQSLHYGIYLAQVTVTMTGLRSEEFDWADAPMNTGTAWIRIVPTNVTATIDGGPAQYMLKPLGKGSILKLTSQSSRDPDAADETKLRYYWLTSNDLDLTRFPGPPKAFDFPHPHCEFMSTQCVSRLSNTSELTLPWDDIPENQVLSVQLVIEVNRTIDDSSLLQQFQTIQIIHVHGRGTQNQSRIRCVPEPCPEKFNSEEPLVLEATCDDCSGLEWSYTSESAKADTSDLEATEIEKSRHRREVKSHHEVFWRDGMEFDRRSSKYLLLRPDKLSYNNTYSFTLSDVAKTEAKTRGANLFVAVNEPPEIPADACTIYPTRGLELRTNFRMECKAFRDDDEPVSYRIFYHATEKLKHFNGYNRAPKGILLYYGRKPYMPIRLLPRGIKTNGYIGTITVEAMDVLGASSYYRRDIQVFPGTLAERTHYVTAERFRSLAIPNSKGFVPDVKKKTSNAKSVMSFVAAVGMMMNMVEPSDTDLRLLSKQRLRGFLLRRLADVPHNGFDGIQQLAAATTIALGRPMRRDFANGSEAVAGAILRRVSEELTVTMDEGPSGPYAHAETAGFILNGLSRIIISLSRKAKLGHIEDLRDGTQQLVDYTLGNNMMDDVFDGIHNVLDAYGKGNVIGQSAIEFQLSTRFIAAVWRDTAANLGRHIVECEVMSKFLTLPATVSFREEGIDFNEAIEVQVVFSRDSTYLDPTKPISTANVELRLKHTNNDSTRILAWPTDPSTMLLVRLPYNGFPDRANYIRNWAIAMPPELYTSENMTIRRIEVELGESVLVWIRLQWTPVPLYFLLHPGTMPTLDDFRSGTPRLIAPFNSAYMKDYFVTVSDIDRDDNGTLWFIAILAGNLSAYLDESIAKTADDYNVHLITNVTFIMQVASARCVAWNNETRSWSDSWCWAAAESESDQDRLHCNCLATSIYGGQIRALESILVKHAGQNLALAFYVNPLLLTVVLVPWLVAIPVAFYLHKLDIREENERGVYVLADNEPSHRHYYVVTVSTGLRPFAGTTAKVGIFVQGELDHSDPHLLNEKDNGIFFGSGHEDSFLLTVPWPLGKLMSIVLWHNGEGTSPSWYVSDVIIRDIQNDQIYVFIVERWLAANKRDRRLSAEIPLASPEDLQNPWRRFHTFSSRGLRDGHLWLSLAFRSPKSFFTRTQRLACLLSLVSSTMMIDLLLNVLPGEPANQRSQFGFAYYWWHIGFGAACSLIAASINGIIVQLFAHAAPEGGIGAIDAVGLATTNPLRARMDLDVLNPALRRLFAIDTVANIFSAPISGKFQDPLVAFVRPKMPYWMRYIAWVSSMGLAVFSTAVVCAKGPNFGRIQSIDCLVIYLISIFVDMIFLQPAQVMLWALFVVLRSDVTLRKDAEGGYLLGRPSLYDRLLNAATAAIYRPPSGPWLSAIRRATELANRFLEWLWDVGWVLAFVLSAFAFVYCSFPQNSHTQKIIAQGLFINDTYSTDFTHSLDIEEGFRGIQTLKLFWTRMISLFKYSPINKIHNDTETALLASIGNFSWTNDELNMLIGPARIIQSRIKPSYCIVPHEMKMFNLTCYPEYSSDIRENRHFTERWHPIRPTKFSEPTEQPEATTAFLRSVHRSRLAKRQHGKSSKISSLLPTTRPSTTAEQQRPNGNSSLINATSTTSSPVNGTEIRDATSKDPGAFWTGTVRPLPVVDPETPKPDKKKENLWCPSCPWSYTTAEELFMPPTYLGKLATYDGGGYAIAVRADDDDTAHVLQLQKLGWIDQFTRAILIMINTYNPATNLLSVTTMTFEFHPSGSIVPSFHIETVTLPDIDFTRDKLILGFGTLTAFFLSCFVIGVIKRVIHQKARYFTYPWNYFDIFLISIGMTMFVMYFIARTKMRDIAETLAGARDEEFAECYAGVVAELHWLRTGGFFIFLCTLNLLKICRIGRGVNTLLYVLWSLVEPMMGFALTLFASMIPFICMGVIMFGRSTESESTFVAGFLAMLHMMLQESGKRGGRLLDYSKSEPILGPLYYAFSMAAALCIFTNLLVALVMFVYTTTKKLYHDDIEQEGKLADFALEKVMRILDMRVRNPVVDYSQFPAAAQMREYLKVVNSLRKRPPHVRLEQWADLISIKELHHKTFEALHELRELQMTGGEEASKTHRADYASNTQEWYNVDLLPKHEIKGSRTYAVNQLDLVASAVDEAKDMAVISNKPLLPMYIEEQLQVHRDLFLAASRELIEIVGKPGYMARKRNAVQRMNDAMKNI